MNECSFLIELTQGQFARVSECDYERVVALNWFARWDKTSKCFYAYTNVPHPLRDGYTALAMHRFILGKGFGDEGFVDHANHDGLDNQRLNLREANDTSSSQNRRRRCDNVSGHKGVARHHDKWRVAIKHNGKTIILGRFDLNRLDQAAEAYRKAALELFGEFACVK